LPFRLIAIFFPLTAALLDLSCFVLTGIVNSSDEK
jgi:hypothetical protein